jgi:hypothetical protein
MKRVRAPEVAVTTSRKDVPLALILGDRFVQSGAVNSMKDLDGTSGGVRTPDPRIDGGVFHSADASAVDSSLLQAR